MNYPILFSPFRLNGLSMKNRITMAPLYTGYGNPDGTVSPLTIDHYQQMAASGCAMVVVENSAVAASGLGAPFMLRVDDDRYITGLARLAKSIHDEGALAFLQINHAGKYAHLAERLAPSPVKTGHVFPKEMTQGEIEQTIEAFASASVRAKEAGFDGVEIHGGSGYLIVQFLSPRTNHRTDFYGGTIENRMRFPLQVVDAVRGAVGQTYAVGYRFLADEELANGLHPDETTVLAIELERREIAYLSVMAGTFDSFSLPEQIEKQKQEAYMSPYAAFVKKSVSKAAIISTGRIQRFETAERLLKDGNADLIGLARVLLADPLWPQKAMGIIKKPVVECGTSCSFCMSQRVMKGRPVYCVQWDSDRQNAFKARIGEGYR